MSGYYSSSSARNTSSSSGQGNQNSRSAYSARDATQSGRYTGSSRPTNTGSASSSNTYSGSCHSRYDSGSNVRRPHFTELDDPPAPTQPIEQPDDPKPNAPTYPSEGGGYGGSKVTLRSEYARPVPNPSVLGWDLEFDDVGRSRETEEPFSSRRTRR
ncbi:hypothetical protein RBB50_001920 [Rhinocladiella similis]